MNVLIAGGSGLIGTAICRALLANGDKPVILTRDRSRAQGSPPGVRIVVWEPPVVGPWITEMARADAVINLAGESIGRWPWSARRKAALLDGRLHSTGTLVDALAAVPATRRPRVLLNASGTDLYVDSDATPATEETPPAETFLAHLCLAWELEAMRAQDLGLRVVLLRTSTVFAPAAPVLRVLSVPFRLFVGGRLGSGQQWMSWIDIEDAVGIYLWALRSDNLTGPVNVAAPDPRRQSDFAQALGSALRRPSWFRTPAWILRLVLGEQATLALGSRRVWPAKALASGYVFKQPRLEGSLRAALRSAD